MKGEFIKGRCVSRGGSTTLNIGTIYYLVPNGSTHYYVHKDPEFGHMGCYRAIYFEIIEDILGPLETIKDEQLTLF